MAMAKSKVIVQLTYYSTTKSGIISMRHALMTRKPHCLRPRSYPSMASKFPLLQLISDCAQISPSSTRVVRGDVPGNWGVVCRKASLHSILCRHVHGRICTWVCNPKDFHMLGTDVLLQTRGSAWRKHPLRRRHWWCVAR